MVALSLIAAVLLKQPAFTAEETRIVADLAKIGGSVAWVRDNPNGKMEWVLSVDESIPKGTHDFHLGQIARLKRLGALRLFQARFDEETLKSLEPLKNLNLLVILSDGLTDKGMAEIGRLKGIVKLDVKGPITQQGLKSLVKMPHLQRLYLYNTSIRDADIGPLFEMKNLVILSLPRTVSRTGAEPLRRALPTTQIERQ